MAEIIVLLVYIRTTHLIHTHEISRFVGEMFDIKFRIPHWFII